MKNLTIILTLVAFGFMAKAQTQDEMKKAWLANAKRTEEMKSGKYIKTDNKNMFVGQWITDEAGKEVEFEIITKKTHFKHGEYDYYMDAMYVEVKKCIYQGEDVSKKIKERIMLTGDSSKYSGMLLKDPITGDDIMIKLYFKDKGTLKLNVNTWYAPGTSTIFPLGDTILKRKN